MLERVKQIKVLLSVSEEDKSGYCGMELGFVCKIFCLPGDSLNSKLSPSKNSELYSKDAISFMEVDIITPAQKLLARQLTFDIRTKKKSASYWFSEVISYVPCYTVMLSNRLLLFQLHNLICMSNY
ncbi:hypothetical protein NC653_013237 [Populus alba x Populus x berolinensis]|uniref:Uncharacterized protein n=1 Tax=Populus alba x Populus x berolinensis TaxID=444605 RepID=A0AAD6QU48_9ROSI|nr:hypothetical protein NC653_013237 [Populus alba x Populus x berolinensis]